MKRKVIRRRLRDLSYVARTRHSAMTRSSPGIADDRSYDRGYYLGLAHGFERAIDMLGRKD